MNRFLTVALIAGALSLTSASTASAHGRGGRGCHGGCYGGCYGGYGGGGYGCCGCYGGGGYGMCYGGYGGSWYGGRGGYAYYGDPSFYGYGYATNPTFNQNSTSMYADASNDNNIAQVRVIVPKPDAQIWIQDTPMQTNGVDRQFVTPRLEQGYHYDYKIKATWRDGNGQQVNREQTVQLRPGDNKTIDLTQGDGNVPSAGVRQ